MNTEVVNQVRQEQTQHELAYLEQAIKAWLKHRHHADQNEQGHYVGRHKAQLEAIESVLLGASQVIHNHLEAMDLNRSIGEVYDECRDYDQAIIGLQRVWEYFKEKFDQRDDARIGPLLRAADEVVWSCYRQVFIRAQSREPGLQQGPTPLSFIEAEYSPAALESDKPLPKRLQLWTDIDLDQYLKTLPVPVVRLPPWCIDAPWWLVYLGHEVGHHVQHDLGLVGYFREGMEKAAEAQNLPRNVVERWGSCGEEIFADIFSVMMIGPWAVWAVSEVELSTPNKMVVWKGKYPSPVVRLSLIARVADVLGLGGTSMLAQRGVPMEELVLDARLGRDMEVIAGAVAFALRPLQGNLNTLETLCVLDPTAFRPIDGKIEKWARLLRGKTSLPSERKLETAREVVSGSLCAWSTIAGLQDVDERNRERQVLATRTKEMLIKSSPPGTRASLAPSGKIPRKGEELAELLLKASRTHREEGR